MACHNGKVLGGNQQLSNLTSIATFVTGSSLLHSRTCVGFGYDPWSSGTSWPRHYEMHLQWRLVEVNHGTIREPRLNLDGLWHMVGHVANGVAREGEEDFQHRNKMIPEDQKETLHRSTYIAFKTRKTERVTHLRTRDTAITHEETNRMPVMEETAARSFHGGRHVAATVRLISQQASLSPHLATRASSSHATRSRTFVS